MLEKVERKINIFFDDEKTDSAISEMMERGKRFLLDVAGSESLNFEEPGAEQELLLEYCLYDWNEKLAEFKKSYVEELNALRQREQVKQYVFKETE